MKSGLYGRLMTVAVLGLLCLLLLSGCGGTKEPLLANYQGTISIEGLEDGTLSFTIDNGAVGGTARFTHNNQQVVAAVSGSFTGNAIEANVIATNLGHGTLTGLLDGTVASGLMTYVDEGSISTTHATWQADENTGH